MVIYIWNIMYTAKIQCYKIYIVSNQIQRVHIYVTKMEVTCIQHVIDLTRYCMKSKTLDVQQRVVYY